jgi:hypothetical protein
MHNRIDSFKYFPNLCDLTHLNLNDNRLISFEHFPSLSKKNDPYLMISLQDNQISSFKHFPIISRVREISLQGNKIDSFEHFPILKNLIYLNLESNYITSFEHFPKCLYLLNINVKYNNIRKLQHIPKIFRLKQIYLQYNPITSCKGLSVSDFIKTSIYIDIDKNNFISNDVFHDLILKDFEEHKISIIKDTNEKEKMLCKLFIALFSDYSIEVILFAIQYDVSIHLNKELIFNNREYIETMCLKYDNDTSKKILEFINNNSKRKMRNGDKIFV